MFNLEDFKKYGKAVRRDGQIVRFIAHVPDARVEYERLVCMDANARLYVGCENGKASLRDIENKFDLVEVVRPMYDVSFSVPEPLSEEPGPGDAVYVLIGGILDPHAVQVIWGAQAPWCRRMTMKLGFIWRTMEEAQAAADVLKKGFRQ
jgi:hypothetical protein